MSFETLEEGYIFEGQADTPTAAATGPRCAVISGNELVCTFMVLPARGLNAFVPMVARSFDGGRTWVTQGPVWPALKDACAIHCSLSRSPNGDLFLFGTSTPIDTPGESDWDEDTHGLKPNQLIWACSLDGGHKWSDPRPIIMPIPGSAEAPAPLWVTRQGRWLACYSPYNTFDPGLVVDHNQVVVLFSDDRGVSWQHRSMLRFEDAGSNAGEAWVVELVDGCMLGIAWQMNFVTGIDYGGAYALSRDGGLTWSTTRRTGIASETSAVIPLSTGGALLVYSRRKASDPGLWLARLRPSEDCMDVETNQMIWHAEKPTQSGSEPDFAGWQDFAFGEPSVTILPDESVFVAFWCIQPGGRGIRYLRLRAT